MRKPLRPNLVLTTPIRHGLSFEPASQNHGREFAKETGLKL